MTKKQLQKEEEKVICGIHKRQKVGGQPRGKDISRFLDMLLIMQVLLGKIEAGENTAFNAMIFKKTANFYCLQMKKYA